MRWNLLQRNIADQADAPSSPPGSVEMKTWTAEELRRFLDFVASDRLYGAWVLAATTGLRRGEVLGLRWGDIDLEPGRLAVRQTLVSVAYETKFSTPKTKRGRRSVSLNATTVMALRSHRKRQLQDRMAWGPAYQDSGLVVTREDGSLVHPDRFTQMFDKHVKNSGLPRIRLHDLRHTHATLAFRRSSQGGKRSARPRHGRLHPRRLLPRRTGSTGRGGGARGSARLQASSVMTVTPGASPKTLS